MFSYEDRVRAVELYFKLGERSAATRRKLGYPAKGTLANWIGEFERHGRLRDRYPPRGPKYSEEQKAAAIEHYIDHGQCFSVTLKALGYPGRGMLTDWVYERHPEFKRVSVGKVSRRPRPLATKQAAVYELCTREDSAQAVADRLDVDRVTLYNWKNQLLGRGAPASMKRSQEPSVEVTKAELEREVESLRRQIRNLELERDLLKKANEIVKKDLGVGLQSLDNQEKAKLVDALREAYSLVELLGALDLPRSSYFCHRARSRGTDKYAEVRNSIGEIFESNHQCYGSRRIRASLCRQRVFVSEKVVRRLMKQENLIAAIPKRRRYGSYLGEIGPAPENIVNRDFRAGAPNEKWLTDISEFQIPAGKVYLSPMIDCFDGMVISWSIGTRPDAELVNGMLDAAVETVADVPD